jgi:hypothetical protein
MTERPDLPYARCPACGFAAQPGSMTYLLAADGGIDWVGTVHASCGICGRHGVASRRPGRHGVTGGSRERPPERAR